jgi:DNA-binding beta-propeller fold protein YncE
VRQFPLLAKDLVVDPNTQTIYASLPSGAGASGNSIAAINPTTGAVNITVFIGSEPGRMALSDDAQFIYVGLDGAASIRRFDVATKTAGLQFGLGSLPFGGGSLTARDISVAPGQPGTVAVVRRSGGSSGGVAFYDDGAPRTATDSQSTTVEFSASPLVLYGFNGDSTEFGFRKIAVGSCGLTTVATTSNLMSGFGADFKVDNATAYSSSGRAFDPEAARIAGTFALVSPNSFL